MNNNNDLTTTWIHKDYPYIPSVSIRSNSTDSEILSALNNALANADLELLHKEIKIGQKLFDFVSAKFKDIEQQVYDSIQSGINIYFGESPSFWVYCSFKIWIPYLQGVQNMLKSPGKITIDELHAFWSGKTDNCHDWILKTKDFKPYWLCRFFSQEDEKKIRHDLKELTADGKVQIFHAEGTMEDESFMETYVSYLRKNTTNPIETAKQIFSVIAPEEVKNYTPNAYYEKDSKLLELQDRHKQKKYFLWDYSIYFLDTEKTD